MNFFEQYKLLIVPIAVWFFIQLFKVIWEFIVTHKFDITRIWGAGGMPSSHSAIATCIATMVGKIDGISSTTFAIAVVFACVVMYDAAGVRRAAGKQAKIINKIVETPEMNSIQMQEKLVEVLGHTPVQVLVGAALGILVGIFV